MMSLLILRRRWYLWVAFVKSGDIRIGRSATKALGLFLRDIGFVVTPAHVDQAKDGRKDGGISTIGFVVFMVILLFNTVAAVAYWTEIAPLHRRMA